MSKVHRSRGWTIAAGVLGATTMLTSILADQVHSFDLFLRPIRLLLLIATVLLGLVSLVVMVILGRTDKLRAAYPLGLCLFFLTASLSWGRLSSAYHDIVIFPVREGTFDQLRSDFQATSGLNRFCSWGPGDYLVNGTFLGENHWHGDVGDRASSKPEREALSQVGMTPNDVDQLARNMRKIGVTCLVRLSDGTTEFMAWGFLDNECGFIYAPSQPPRLLPGSWTRPIKNGWYRYCTSLPG